ncbi:hypothetical protein ACWGN5_33870 [Streptomyces sp. NPDC055815]
MDGMLDVRGRPRRIVATIRERHHAVQELLAQLPVPSRGQP